MRNNTNNRMFLVGLGMLILTAGLFYYALFRDINQLLLIHLPGVTWLSQFVAHEPINIEFPLFHSLPAFIHTLGMSFFTIGLLGLSRRGVIAVPLFWVGFNWLFETGQRFPEQAIAIIPDYENSMSVSLGNYFSNGVFDWNDILAAGLALPVVLLLLRQHVSPTHEISFVLSRLTRRVLAGCVFFIGLGSLMGTSGPICYTEGDDKCTFYGNYEPVYLSYDELRNAVATNDQQPLEDIGKIYLYQTYLFVNSKNKGVHVYDNNDPANPVHLTFVNVPGNIDIAIKNGVLYLDSYIDLVAVDLSDMNDLREVARIENVFPYDPYQALPDGIYLKNYDVNKGVVVGYKETDNEN